jgi:hypothetical protein
MFVHTCCSLQIFGPMFSYDKGGVVVKWRRFKEISERTYLLLCGVQFSFISVSFGRIVVGLIRGDGLS